MIQWFITLVEKRCLIYNTIDVATYKALKIALSMQYPVVLKDLQKSKKCIENQLFSIWLNQFEFAMVVAILEGEALCNVELGWYSLFREINNGWTKI